jgi:hypothetical protein
MRKKQIIVIMDDRDPSAKSLSRSLCRNGVEVRVVQMDRRSLSRRRQDRVELEQEPCLQIGKKWLEAGSAKFGTRPIVVSVHSREWEFIISKICNRTGYGFIHGNPVAPGVLN